jgi:predicted transglutaminase-like cysteine proteinase
MPEQKKWNPDLKPFPKFTRATEGWNAPVTPMQAAPADILKRVQQSYAKMKYIVDGEDLWATPEEFKQRGGGDCEDFALAKYHALLQQGFSDDQMRVLIGQKRKTGEFHAVLTVRDGDNLYVLDNEYPDKVLGADHLKSISRAYEINRTGWGR